jgi:plastocyanin
MNKKILVASMILLTVLVVACTQQPGYSQSTSGAINPTNNPPVTETITTPASTAPSPPSTQNTPDTTVQPETKPTSSQGTTYKMDISGFAFSKVNLQIKAGDTVIWTNLDVAPHTVTSDSGSELDSPNILKGQTYSHTFNTAGVYTYHCGVHPSMKATITVT